jgi:hypothetical protein
VSSSLARGSGRRRLTGAQGNHHARRRDKRHAGDCQRRQPFPPQQPAPESRGRQDYVFEHRHPAGIRHLIGLDHHTHPEQRSGSLNKGPEPEAVEIAFLNGKYYAFIGLERIGGIMVYDVTNPASPNFVEFVNNRDFTAVETDSATGDLGVEDVLFINSTASPDGKNYIENCFQDAYCFHYFSQQSRRPECC